MERIDPHEHAVSRQELLAYIVGELLVIDRRLGIDADLGKLFEDPLKAVVLWCGGLSGCSIAAPQDADFVGFRVRFASVHATLLAWRVAQSLDGRLTGCLLDPAAILSAPLQCRQSLIRASPKVGTL